jgi:hypothetical protein
MPPLTWLGVLGFALWGMLPGMIVGYAFHWQGRLGFALASVVVFTVLLAQINPALQAQGPFPNPETLFYMRYSFETGMYEVNQIFYATVPFAILIALGGHTQLITSEIREWLDARKARRLAASANTIEFLNRPKAALPDTATLVDAVRQAREELSKTGMLPTETARIMPDVATVMIDQGKPIGVNRVSLDAPTGKIDIDTQAEIRKARESDT